MIEALIRLYFSEGFMFPDVLFTHLPLVSFSSSNYIKLDIIVKNMYLLGHTQRILVVAFCSCVFKSKILSTFLK